MIFAAILAGGSGVRMGTALPKQFLPLGGEPVLIHTLRPFLSEKRIDRIVLGVHPEWTDYAQKLLTQYFPGQADAIPVVPGGCDRSETMLHVICRLESEYGADPENVILTHDGVRPFVSPATIAGCIDAVLQFGACTVAYPAVDTILSSADGVSISDIPDRRLLWQTQTPQCFRIQQLKEVYLSLSDEERKTLTDANKIFLLRGIPVHLVTGSPLNMKITTAEDYRLACLIAAGEDGNPPKK